MRGSLAAREEAHFAPDVARLTARIAEAGFARALARVLLHIASPGVPDIYQGDELWNFTLVDPDNRRPVDYDRAIALLAKSDAGADVVRNAFDGTLGEDRVKQAVTARLLRLRREYPALFVSGEYLPLELPQGHIGFGRRTKDELALALARTRTVGEGTERVRGVQIRLPADFEGRWRSALTGREIELVNSGQEITIWADELAPAHINLER